MRKYKPNKPARWIEWNDGWFHGVMCSECLKQYVENIEEVKQFKQCPNCGVEMQTEDENSISIEQAIRILHPDTTEQALCEFVEKYESLSTQNAMSLAIEKATILACQIMQEKLDINNNGEK